MKVKKGKHRKKRKKIKSEFFKTELKSVSL